MFLQSLPIPSRCLAMINLKKVARYFSRVIRYISRRVVTLAGKTRAVQCFLSVFSEYVFSSSVKVSHNGVSMQLLVPNDICQYRASTFSTKEPDTLRWLEGIPCRSTLWDIGANIGLYSIYAAIRQNAHVIAFEPSVFNLEILARNIHLNNLQKLIQIVPIALSDSVGPSLFKMTNTAWGGALSTFGQDFDQNGMLLNSSFEYNTIGLSMDNSVESLGIPLPDFLKIDVDGIEHLILRGGACVLDHVKSVLVEINDDFEEQALEAAFHLRKSGLKLAQKYSTNSNNQYNQLWNR